MIPDDAARTLCDVAFLTSAGNEAFVGCFSSHLFLILASSILELSGNAGIRFFRRVEDFCTSQLLKNPKLNMASFVCRSVFAATRRGVSTTAVRAADRGNYSKSIPLLY